MGKGRKRKGLGYGGRKEGGGGGGRGGGGRASEIGMKITDCDGTKRVVIHCTSCAFDLSLSLWFYLRSRGFSVSLVSVLRVQKKGKKQQIWYFFGIIDCFFIIISTAEFR